MPPLAATLAATLAMRAGLSLARAARERRPTLRAAEDRRFKRLVDEPLGHALQRMALGQLDIAIEWLESAGASDADEKAIHETRKALKRLRALLRLLEAQLGEEVFAREDALLTDSGKRLAGARDAEVLLETLDALIACDRRKLEGRGGVVKLRAQLVSEREAARRAAFDDPAGRAQALAQLRACRARVASWNLEDEQGFDLVQAGLARLYRQGRARYRRAAHGRGKRTHVLHSWRKRVKDLRYAAQMFEVDAQQAKAARPKKGSARRQWRRARKDAAWLRRVSRRADRLGELLGEEHDLAVLEQRLEERPHTGKRIGRRSRRALKKSIAARRRELRKAALREGERLYRRAPRKFVRRVRRSQRAAHGD